MKRVTINGGTLVLKPGCQLYVSGVGAEALKVTSNGVIRAEGNNTLFVEDGVGLRADGYGIVNTTHSPREMQLYAKGRYTSGAKILLAKKNVSLGDFFYGVVYHDNGDVFLDRRTDWTYPDYKGALAACGTVTLKTAAWGADLTFEYDPTLADLPFPEGDSNTPRYRLSGWWLPQ